MSRGRSQFIVGRALFCLLALLTGLLWVRFAATASAATAPAVSTFDAGQVDAFVSAEMERHGLPGMALALVEGDQVVFMKGYGKADQTGRPVTPQTPFLLASVSKPLTASAVMQLVETGQIELDAPVQRYLPDFRVSDPAASSQITVRHLLLHTSGIPVTACDTRRNASTLAEYVAELHKVSLAAPPGARHSYCSGNYNVLGRIIETVTGRSFGSYMEQHVFAPLDMQHSFTTEQDALDAGLAQGYQWAFGLLLPTHHRYNPSQLPSGYMLSSAEDMSHFLIAQLNRGSYGGNSLLTAGSITAMQTRGTDRGKDGGYGLGWVIAPFGGVQAVWHDGVNNNYHAFLLMQPEARRGVVLLMNSFGIVPYESAYREIKEGVVRLLNGLEAAPRSALSLGILYLSIDVVLAGVLALALFPLLRMRRWNRATQALQQAGRAPRMRGILRSVWEIGFGLVFIIGIRLVIVTGLGAQSWVEVFTAFPDFVGWVWAFTLTWLATGVIRLRLILIR